MAYMSGVALLSKLAALGSQWVLGLMLLPADFALYAAVLSAQTVIMGLREAGVGKYLIQKGNFHERAYPTAIFALWSNLVACALLWTVAPWLARGFRQPELLVLLVPVTLLLPLQSLATVLQAKARIDMRFRSIALIETTAMVGQNLIIAGLALKGAGVYSLICGTAVGVIVQLFGYRALAGKSFRAKRWTFGDMTEIFHVCKWIMLTSVALSLGLRGDYLVLGFGADKELVGTYFFGVQLVMSAIVLFSSSIQSVVLPAFSKVAGDGIALTAAFTATQQRLARLAVPAFVFAGAVAPLGINIFWGGKWNASTMVVQCFLLIFAFRLQSSISLTLLESCGYWRQRMLLGFAEGLLVMIGAAIGLCWKSVPVLAISGAVARLGSSLLQMWIAARITSIPGRPALRACVRNLLFYLSLSVAACLVVRLLSPVVTNEAGLSVLEGGAHAFAIGVGYYILWYRRSADRAEKTR